MAEDFSTAAGSGRSSRRRFQRLAPTSPIGKGATPGGTPFTRPLSRKRSRSIVSGILSPPSAADLRSAHVLLSGSLPQTAFLWQRANGRRRAPHDRRGFKLFHVTGFAPGGTVRNLCSP